MQALEVSNPGKWRNWQPDTVRVKNLNEYYGINKGRRERSFETDRELRSFSFGVDRGEPVVVTGKGEPLHFSCLGFQQMCSRLGAGAGYKVFQRLQPDTVATAMNELKKLYLGSEKLNLLVEHDKSAKHQNTLRSVTSELYTRVWDSEVDEMLLNTLPGNWEVACDGQALVVSNKMSYRFFYDPSKVINDGTEHGLWRGFVVGNSEVGAGSFSLTTFLFRSACLNSLIFGMIDCKLYRIRHIGAANERAVSKMGRFLKDYAEASPLATEKKIISMQNTVIADEPSEVVDILYHKLGKAVSRKALNAARGLAVKHRDVDGDPSSVWGMLQGLTRYSQTFANTDERNSLDVAAGKLVALAA